MNEDGQSVSYVYGFTQADVAGGTSAAMTQTGGSATVLCGGIDESHPPLFWQSGEVAAIVSQVSRSEFCGPAGEANLQELVWLAARACRHQAVLEQVMRLGPVLPARLGTLFSSPASLERFIRKHEAAIAQFLERVDGREEWAVKGFFDPACAEAEWLARRQTEDPGPTASSPGIAYLQEQSLRIQAKRALDDWLAEACDHLLRELKPLASEMVARRIVARETEDAAREMVLNWALLVPTAAAKDFRRRIERANAEHNRAGMAFEATGPWPPYSFCPVLEAEAAAPEPAKAAP